MLSYRSRRALRRLCTVLLVLALLVALGLLCWLLWLNRFVIYTKDGVKLDFGISDEFQPGQLAGTQSTENTIQIEFDQTEPTEPPSTELKQLSGYYITLDMLKGDMSSLKEQIAQLPKGTPVMLDVKSIRGEFYYSSNVGNPSSAVSQAALDDLIAFLRDGGYYVIGRLPAFRDYQFGLRNVACGLMDINKVHLVALWMDETKCYWLKPDADGTVQHLVRIVTELRTLGFDEVLFYDFRFPDTDQIYYTGDKTAALATCAQTLVTACTSETFTVSFTSTDPTFPLPEGRCRLYMENVAAENVLLMAEQAGMTDPELRMVFLANTNDNRYDDYGVLRPLDSAH
ncbi:MAG: hypothetical protein IJA45_04765 [Oscillospiraceae bacterium]|nr:hypothetical protein [Oscillospiraceae bacterium]